MLGKLIQSFRAIIIYLKAVEDAENALPSLAYA
jgi:hypothetical protein